MKYAIRFAGGWLIHGTRSEHVVGRHVERGWLALWTRRDTAVALAERHNGRVIRVYTAAEARDRAAARELLRLADELSKTARRGARALAAKLRARAEELAHCPCKGPDEDPGPHSKCCPWRDPNYERYRQF